MQLIQSLYGALLRPHTFAAWAVARKSSLNARRRRRLEADGGVLWEIGRESGPCSDHLELSGEQVSAILSYGKGRSGELRLMRHLVAPNLRVQPNVTQSSFSRNFSVSPLRLRANGKNIPEALQTVSIRGTLLLTSECGGGLQIRREMFPAADCPALIETVTLINGGAHPISIQAENRPVSYTLPASLCVGGAIRAGADASQGESFREGKPPFQTSLLLQPGEHARFFCVYFAAQSKARVSFSIQKQIDARRRFIVDIFSGLRLETPLKELNAQFSHCVLRGCESIFRTKGGLMHSPGGGSYYAALWTNDQCEYANPFFPFSGYQKGIEQAVNCYALYEAYMDRSDRPMREKRALVTSIISGGDGYWNGAGDRGDGAMYAYGLSRFLLEMGDKALIRRFYDSFVWCMDFTLSRKTPQGVIASDSDELENRFPSGEANLFTSCLAFDAMTNGILLAGAMEDKARAALWSRERAALRDAIERYFGSRVEGFDTYRYYDGNQTLRSWICMPLTVEIFDRADETVRALFSDRLYQNGMLRTASDNRTTWDRSLLYALRGVLLAGKAEEGTRVLLEYCRNRLLGSHAPYPFEAYPEGNRAQLAAESLLFARAVTEGLFGLRAVGLAQLRIHPQLSRLCPEMRLNGLRLFGRSFDVAAGPDGITILLDGRAFRTARVQAVFDFETLSFAT